jgi:hypothetical protein
MVGESIERRRGRGRYILCLCARGFIGRKYVGDDMCLAAD